MVGTEGDTSEKSETVWHRSSSAVALLVVDVLVLVVAAAGTTLLVTGVAPDFTTVEGFSVPVPWEVYAFSVLGAFGYVFTAFVMDFDRTPSDVLEYQFHVFAAIPLGAGVYLFASLLLGTDGPVPGNDRLVAGLAFVAGLYVKLTYRRIGALAERLLPEKSGRTERTGATDEPES